MIFSICETFREKYYVIFCFFTFFLNIWCSNNTLSLVHWFCQLKLGKADWTLRVGNSNTLRSRYSKQKCQFGQKLYAVDTSLSRPCFEAPMLSTVERFHCIWQNYCSLTLIPFGLILSQISWRLKILYLQLMQTVEIYTCNRVFVRLRFRALLELDYWDVPPNVTLLLKVTIFIVSLTPCFLKNIISKEVSLTLG